MIVSQVPLRLSFNGGGSDLPSYSSNFRGTSLTTTLNKHVYVTINKSFNSIYRIAYSRIEHTASIDEIAHPIVRATLQYLNWTGPALEITSIADVPSHGTGLGTSSAFTIALILALKKMRGESVDFSKVAQMAVDIEVRVLNSPIGVQDQYASALGGLIVQDFLPDLEVEFRSLYENRTEERLAITLLNDYVLFFHIDTPRSASHILENQSRLLQSSPLAIEITHEMVQLAKESEIAILQQRYHHLGQLISKGWQCKMKLNGDLENEYMVNLFRSVANSGAYGGKLLGAGSGGFLMLVAEPNKHSEVIRFFSNLRHHTFRITGHSPRVYSLHE